MSAQPRVLVVGAGGQVGWELQKQSRDFGDVTAVDRRAVDLTVPDQIRTVVRRVKPQVILNAAAYTAVDRAESEQELAMAVNACAPGILAEEARDCGALLVHYSTDYVFDGEQQEPWKETDEPNPQNFYGVSKLAGERAIAAVGGNFLIFRTSWVYGPHGSNFLHTMLRLARQRSEISVVNDQFGAPTTSIELAKATLTVVQEALAGKSGEASRWAGLYHMTCSGSTTWFGFAQAIFARAGRLLEGKGPAVVPIPARDYPSPARRPQYSVLCNANLCERFDVRLAPWEAALDDVIRELEG